MQRPLKPFLDTKIAPKSVPNRFRNGFQRDMNTNMDLRLEKRGAESSGVEAESRQKKEKIIFTIKSKETHEFLYILSIKQSKTDAFLTIL